MDFSLGQDMPVFGRCIDIFGDSSFWAIPTPGHTKGHISYLINGNEEKVLVTGDACITQKGFNLGIETGKFSLDLEDGRKSFLKIKDFANIYPFVKLIFGHETGELKIQYI